MKDSKAEKALSALQRQELLGVLQTRFDKNPKCQKSLQWAAVQARLEASPGKLWSLGEMEKTGGEPDVIGQDKKTSEYLFSDCSTESPQRPRESVLRPGGMGIAEGTRPKNTAIDLAAEMGIELLTEEQFLNLQKLGEFDLKTSKVFCRTFGLLDRSLAVIVGR